MSKEQLTLLTSEFVEMFGNQKQKEGYAKTKKIAKKTKEAIIREAKTKWEKVDYTKNPHGRGNVFILSNKLDEVKDKRELQNYSNCGQGQLPYKDDIRKTIINYLHINRRNNDIITYKNLLHKLGIVNDVMHNASKKFAFVERKAFYDNLDDKYKTHGHAIFWEVVQMEHSRLTDNLKSVLQDMAKHKIVRLWEFMTAVLIDEEGKEIEHLPLQPQKAKIVDDGLAELRAKHDVTLKDLMYKPRDKTNQIKNYREDEQKYFRSLGFSYVYKAISVYLRATNREMEKYKEKVLSKEIRQKHLQHAYELAVKRQEDYLLKSLGGKLKPAHAVETNQEAIASEKLDRTYANNYKGALGLINEVK